MSNPQLPTTQNPPQPVPRPFRPRQFLLGLLFSGTGVSLVLSVAFLTDTVRTVTALFPSPQSAHRCCFQFCASAPALP